MRIFEAIKFHYIKWSLVYGISGAAICTGTAIGWDSLRNGLFKVFNGNTTAELIAICTYVLSVFTPAFLATTYAIYIIFIAKSIDNKNKQKKRGENNETSC